MTDLATLIGDTTTISQMDDAHFDQYWQALGTVIRLASQAHTPHPPPEPELAEGELSCTSATTQIAPPARDWRRPTPKAFGFSSHDGEHEI
jgi:hypothetical protein